MSYLPDIPDHPIIRNLERTGLPHPEIDEDEEPICPVCGEACSTAFLDSNGDALGCENCIQRKDAWDFPDYLPKQKARMEAAGW